MNDFPSHVRIVIIGSSGAGKSTLAKALSHKLSVPHIELDALNWEAGWTQADNEVFRERVRLAVTRPGGWVVAGNYHNVRDLTWAGASVVIWLDFAFPVVFWRTLKRTILRSLRAEILWNGNRESLVKAFFSKDSILLWLIQTYSRRRRQTPELLSEYSHVKLLHFKYPREADAFLARLENKI